MLSLVVLNAIFATSIPLAKVLVKFSSPLFVLAMRMLIAGIVLLIYQYWWARKQFIFKKEHWHLYAQATIFSIVLKYTFRYWGLGYVPAGKTAFLLQARPFIVALLSYVMFNECLTLKKWLGMFIGFIGLVPLILLHPRTDMPLGQFFYISWPEIAILVSVIAHSCGLMATRTLVKELRYSASMVNGICMFGGGFLALLMSWSYEGIIPVVREPFLFSGYLLALILVSNILSHNYCMNLLKSYSATFLCMLDFFKPIFTTLYGWLFLHELVTWHFYVSGFLVMVGLYLFYLDEGKDTPPVTIMPARTTREISFEIPVAGVIAREKENEHVPPR